MAVRIEYGHGKSFDDLVFELRETVEKQRAEIEALRRQNTELTRAVNKDVEF